MDATKSMPLCRAASPPLRPAPDQPGSLFEQFQLLADFLSLPDHIRADPAEWDRARRRRIPHARRRT